MDATLPHTHRTRCKKVDYIKLLNYNSRQTERKAKKNNVVSNSVSSCCEAIKAEASKILYPVSCDTSKIENGHILKNITNSTPSISSQQLFHQILNTDHNLHTYNLAPSSEIVPHINSNEKLSLEQLLSANKFEKVRSYLEAPQSPLLPYISDLFNFRKPGSLESFYHKFEDLRNNRTFTEHTGGCDHIPHKNDSESNLSTVPLIKLSPLHGHFFKNGLKRESLTFSDDATVKKLKRLEIKDTITPSVISKTATQNLPLLSPSSSINSFNQKISVRTICSPSKLSPISSSSSRRHGKGNGKKHHSSKKSSIPSNIKNNLVMNCIRKSTLDYPSLVVFSRERFPCTSHSPSYHGGERIPLLLGTLYPHLYTSSEKPCIVCNVCGNILGATDFLIHQHDKKMNGNGNSGGSSSDNSRSPELHYHHHQSAIIVNERMPCNRDFSVRSGDEDSGIDSPPASPLSSLNQHSYNTNKNDDEYFATRNFVRNDDCIHRHQRCINKCTIDVDNNSFSDNKRSVDIDNDDETKINIRCRELRPLSLFPTNTEDIMWHRFLRLRAQFGDSFFAYDESRMKRDGYSSSNVSPVTAVDSFFETRVTHANSINGVDSSIILDSIIYQNNDVNNNAVSPSIDMYGEFKTRKATPQNFNKYWPSQKSPTRSPRHNNNNNNVNVTFCRNHNWRSINKSVTTANAKNASTLYYNYNDRFAMTDDDVAGNPNRNPKDAKVEKNANSFDVSMVHNTTDSVDSTRDVQFNFNLPSNSLSSKYLLNNNAMIIDDFCSKVNTKMSSANDWSNLIPSLNFTSTANNEYLDTNNISTTTTLQPSAATLFEGISSMWCNNKTKNQSNYIIDNNDFNSIESHDAYNIIDDEPTIQTALDDDLIMKYPSNSSCYIKSNDDVDEIRCSYDTDKNFTETWLPLLFE